jgi:hypothetical protein
MEQPTRLDRTMHGHEPRPSESPPPAAGRVDREPVRDLPVRGVVRELEGVEAKPLDGHHRGQAVGQNAADYGPRLQIFEPHEVDGIRSLSLQDEPLMVTA